MAALSPWALAACGTVNNNDYPVLYTGVAGTFEFRVYASKDSLWIAATGPSEGKILFRAAFCPGKAPEVQECQVQDNGVDILLRTAIGDMRVEISLMEEEHPILHYHTQLTPYTDLFIPFWPRDIIIAGTDGNTDNTIGRVHMKQMGTRSGHLFFSLAYPKTGSVLYLQNLTALGDYNELTTTSAKDVVGGDWPELGFSLPATNTKPMPAGRTVTISDAFVAFDTQTAANEAELVKQFLDMLASVYLQLPHPETVYRHWPDILGKGLYDLTNNHGCWTQINGKKYLNAYLCDYRTPPEIMVQLAVLLPLLEYSEWSGKQLEAIDTVQQTLADFYNPELKTVMRWLPAAEHWLEGEQEEQKAPLTMDSWYLHHPLLNLSRLAKKGNEQAHQLLIESIDYAINVAHHFGYKWPVFYKMDTLEVVKAETAPGKGGEKDVAGLYAHVMLQAWEITGNQKYFDEARKAADTLKGLGFDLFYQVNNTAFAAKAMLILWKETRDETYLDLSYVCIANILRNAQLWECNYGHGKHFPNFFSVFPLNDAPYTAPYEEVEVFASFHEYLRLAEGAPVRKSVRLLLNEYIRYLVHRACFYYPPMLPKEMLKETPTTGELQPDLWLVLEDLHDGWEQSGEVGQEVYGAGNAFGVVPRHYFRVPDAGFMLFADYQVTNFQLAGSKCVTFDIQGDPRLSCRIVILKVKSDPLPAFKFAIEGKPVSLRGKLTPDGHPEYEINGGRHVTIEWE